MSELQHVAVRRLGSGTIHLAEILTAEMVDATYLGAECTLVVPPVATVCGATLRGDIVVMTRYQTVCRPCERLGHRLGINPTEGTTTCTTR